MNRDDLDRLHEWFANEPPEWLVPVGDTFAGVAVYERLPEHRRDDEDNRIGLATGNSIVGSGRRPPTSGHSSHKRTGLSRQRPTRSWPPSRPRLRLADAGSVGRLYGRAR